MAKVTLSVKAEEDITNTILFGLERFGTTQTVLFKDGLDIKLKMLANNPQLGAKADFVRQGYRRSVYEGYGIFYTQQDNGIRVVRILNRQNITEDLFLGDGQE